MTVRTLTRPVDTTTIRSKPAAALSIAPIRKRRACGLRSQRRKPSSIASARRASSLTHRLLAFSRRQPLDPKPVKVNPLVVSMEDMLRRTLGERVEPVLMLGGDLWLTLCDPNQLESAILNLCINARDAMPDGGRLSIETSNAQIDAAYAARARDIRPGDILMAHLGFWSRQDPWAPAVLDPLLSGLAQRGLCFAPLREHPRYAPLFKRP